METHIRSQKHQKSVKVCSGTQDLTKLFGQQSSTSNAISLAEATLVYFLVNHHLAYRTMDCTPKMLCKNFPDSEMIRSVKCARTKAEAIVNKVLGPHSVQAALQNLEGVSCFGVCTDGSNHGNLKIFPVVIQYFDYRQGGLQAKLLELTSIPDETSETISSLIIDTLTGLDIAEKCVAFGGDNINTNFGGLGRGEGNNILTKLKNSFSRNVVGIGCPAHILHNCIQHGADRLQVDLSCVVNKIYHYFSIYAVRTEKLKEYCKFVEIDYKQLRSTTKTRWLSMFPAIERLLEMYEALQSFFLSESRPPQLLITFFSSRVSKAYLWHMHSLMVVFHENLEKIQREKNSVIDVRTILENVCSLLEYRLECSFISSNTEEQLAHVREDGFDREADAFMEDAMLLYRECLEYLRKWSVSFEDYDCFKWMDLTEKVFINHVKKIHYIFKGKGTCYRRFNVL